MYGVVGSTFGVWLPVWRVWRRNCEICDGHWNELVFVLLLVTLVSDDFDEFVVGIS